MMRRFFITGALTASMFVSLVPAAAHAAADPTAKQLKRALITKWKGKKAHLVRSGTARSVIAGQDRWSYSRLPDRCQTAATVGLLFSGRLGGRPAAMSLINTRGSFYGETLVSVPSSTRLPAQAVPPRCGRVTVKHYDGKRITVRITKVTDLPDIPGARVSAVKVSLTPSPWKHLPKPEYMVTVVRSGSTVMETYADASNGNVERVANGFTEAAWRRIS
ncbi:hypothetical protein ACQEUU_00345 [Nonomuraea sp. CA-218870]|uniref:hypothetical protein n=1 Tax=Nonomuraea sp. CA-218870 TaxID=3239998 RepID=UPI003D93CC43